jgi:ribonuclease-3
MQENRTDFGSIQRIIGYHFKDENLLIRALTTAAYANEHKDALDQTVLSTLGDGILKAILTEKAFRSSECGTSGNITENRIGNEADIALAKIAKKNCFKFSKHLRCSKAERQEVLAFEDLQSDLHWKEMSKSEKGGATHYANTLEAIIGAIFIDSDFCSVRRTALEWY